MNKVKEYTVSDVVPALLQAGLPPTSIPDFLTALASGSLPALQAVPEVSPAAIQAGVATFTQAYAKAFKIVWLATLAFGLLAVIASFFTTDIDDKLSHDVVRRLDGSNKTVDEEKLEKLES